MRQECRISIITVNYNGLNETCSMLDSIASVGNTMEVIVVDNASFADEATEIEKRYPWVRVIRNSVNSGFAGGNNVGIREAHGRYLFLVNNDTVFDPTGLSALADRMDKSPQTAIISPKLRFYYGERHIQFSGYTPLSRLTLRNRAIGFGESDNGQYDTPHSTPYAHGAAMLVSREAIGCVGMLPECYFLYYEELDWSLMMRRKGYDIIYDPVLTVFHKESATTGSDSPLRTYYITRNRFLFARRNVGKLVRWGTYAYLSCLVLPRDIFSHVVHRRWDLARSCVKGFFDFILL